MGKRRSGYALQAVPKARLGGLDARHVRTPWSLPSFAFLSTVCFVLVPIIDPSAAFAMTVEKVTARRHLVAGLMKIHLDIDTAVAIIRSSDTVDEARQGLASRLVPAWVDELLAT